MKKKTVISACMMLVVLTGCASVSGSLYQAEKLFENKDSGKRQEHVYKVPERAEGSLWSETEGIALFPDRRARQVGDIVIVRIVEDPEAELSANTKTSRTSSVDASKLEVLGFMKALAEKNRRLAQNPGQDDLMLASLGLKHDGSGSSDRDGHVKAYVSAIVERILPNGNLYVSGSREITVNNETEYITLSGIIRPDDIGRENEISSAYVADARIAYSGRGPVADKQRPGWLMGVIDYVWPF